MAIHVDHTGPTLRAGERKLQEAFGGRQISFGRQQEINRVPGRIDGPIQISPLPCHPNIRFIDPPRPIGPAHLASNAFFKMGAYRRTQRAMVE